MPADRSEYVPDAEVVDLCRDLIRIDTSNYGPDPGPGEREAAEYVAGRLDDVGIASELYESEPGRTSLVAHWEPEGVDRSLSPLLIHGHLDVVPANAEDWSQPPFAGEIVDGCLWGRGAVDMKDFDAMLLSVVRARARAGVGPASAAPPGVHGRRGGGRGEGGSLDGAGAPRVAGGVPRRRSARWGASP